MKILGFLVWLLVMIAAFPLHSLAAITAISLLLAGRPSLIAGAVICGCVLYFVGLRFVPGFRASLSFVSRHRRQWTNLCLATYRAWSVSRSTREDECDAVPLDDRRADDA